jgi:hypothetical protein
VRRSLLAGSTLILLLAGCSEPVDPLPDLSISEPASAGPLRSLPPPSHHWKGLSAQCPELTGEAARAVGVSGPGAPTDDYQTYDVYTRAACHWGATDTAGNAVDAELDLWPGKNGQVGADAAWQVLTASAGTPVRVGDEGFVDDELGAVVVRTRYGNAVATVRLVPPSAKPDLAALRKAAVAITGDVLDDLVE